MNFIDKIGRRTLLIRSLLGRVAAMCVEAILGWYVDLNDINANKDALRAAIAMFFVFPSSIPLWVSFPGSIPPRPSQQLFEPGGHRWPRRRIGA